MASVNENILVRLQETIESWTAEVTDAQDSLNQQIGATRQQLSSLIQVLSSDKDERVSDAEKDTAQLESRLASVEKDLEATNATRRGLDEEISRLQVTIDNLEQSDSRLQEELQSAVEEKSAALARITELEQEIQIRDDRIDTLSLDSEESVTHANELQTELEDLRGESKDSRDQIERVSSQLAEAQQQASEAAAERDEHSARATELSEKIDEKERARDEALEEVARLCTQVESFEEHAKTSQAGQGEMAQELEALKKLRDELASEYESLTAELAMTTKALEGEGAVGEEMRAKITEQETKLSEFANQQTRLQDKAGETIRKLTEVEEERNSLREELDEAARKHQSLEEEVQSTVANAEQARSKATALEEAVETERGEKDLALESQATAESVCSDLESRLNSLQDNNLKETETLRSELTSAQTLATEHSSKLEEAEIIVAQMQELKTQSHHVETERQNLAEYRLELDTFESFLNEKAKELNSAAEELEELENHASTLQSEIEALNAAQKGATPSRLDEAVDSSAQSSEDSPTEQRVEELEKMLKTKDTQLEEYATTVQNQENILDKYQGELKTIIAYGTKRATEDEELKDLFEEAQTQLQSLNSTLQHRETELTSLREAAAGASSDDLEQRIACAVYDAQGRRRAMGEILVNAGIIKQNQLERALQEQKTSNGRRLGTILVEIGLIQDDIVSQVLASQLGLAFVQMDDLVVQEEALALISGQMATHHMCIPLYVSSVDLTIAMANPLDLLAIEDIESDTGLTIRPVVASLSDITSAIVRHYGVEETTPKPHIADANIEARERAS